MKGIKFSQGYAKVVWYEELDEFNGMNEIRNLNQSLLRGGNGYKVFYSYNPPSSVNSWVNEESLINREDRLVHHSSYLDVDKNWLGDQFIIEAEELKKNNETAYRHEYLGEITGTGGLVFSNITVRAITEVESSQWDKNGYRRGLDFGFAIDPSSYTVCNYDKKKKILYILKDYTQTQLSNKDLAEYMKKDRYSRIPVIADSAEPKSISEISSYGISIRGAKKGPDSIEYGIKFLQSLNEIVIDQTCAKTAVREFCTYEYARTRDGTFQNRYSDKNNHCIDSIRYSLDNDMKPNTWVGI